MKNRAARRVYPTDLEDGLGEVDADGGDDGRGRLLHADETGRSSDGAAEAVHANKCATQHRYM
jgi:hypothetical protein